MVLGGNMANGIGNVFEWHLNSLYRSMVLNGIFNYHSAFEIS